MMTDQQLLDKIRKIVKEEILFLSIISSKFIIIEYLLTIFSHLKLEGTELWHAPVRGSNTCGSSGWISKSSLILTIPLRQIPVRAKYESPFV